MTTTRNIGRAPDNDIVIAYPEISGHHARILIAEDGHVSLEDLGSTNGTFVNRKKIKLVTVKATDSIKFAQYQFELKKLLGEGKQVYAPKIADYADGFNALQQVYDNYVATKIQVGKKMRNTKMLRGVLSFIPIVGAGLGQVSENFLDNQEKILLLEEDFKVKYCCPACGQFLGNIPWVNLARKNQCSQCRVQWVNK